MTPLAVANPEAKQVGQCYVKGRPGPYRNGVCLVLFAGIATNVRAYMVHNILVYTILAHP